MDSHTVPSNKTILIVGGAGYIGSYVNKILHLKGYRTVVFDNLSRGCRSNASYGDFFQGDLSNIPDLKSVFRKNHFDAIMHFAAFADVGESVQNPAKYYKNNVSGTLNLLEMALKFGVLTFIFSSSAAIFGLPQAPSIDEKHPCNPINPYGESKWMVEKILHDFDIAYGLKSCCLRYFNAAGADPEGQLRWIGRKESNLIPLLLKSINPSEKRVTIFGNDYPTPDGTCIRDYIHIHDLAVAHILGLEKLWMDRKSSAYNLGNGKGFSVKNVVEAVQQVVGKSLPIIEGARRMGDPPILIANPAKAERELGWHPQYTDLKTMIQHAYEAMDF